MKLVDRLTNGLVNDIENLELQKAAAESALQFHKSQTRRGAVLDFAFPQYKLETVPLRCDVMIARRKFVLAILGH